MSQLNQNTTALQELLEAVNNLPSGEGGGGSGEIDPIELQSKTVTPTKSVQNVVADSGYDGLSKVTVNAIPSDYIIPSGTKIITANGTVDVESYANVSVNVPVPDGYIKPSGSLEITENGTYDVTQKASVSVNVETIPSNAGTELVKKMVSRSGDFSLTATDLQGITRVGASAFYDCRNIKSVILPEGVTSIGNTAFYYCTGMTSVTFPTTLSSIGSNSFAYSDITSVTIFENITKIDNSAFYRCNSLTIVTIKATTPPTLGTNVFRYSDALTQIIVPVGCANAYKAATNWSTYADIIVEES